MTEQGQVQGTTGGEFVDEPYDPMEAGMYEAKLARIFTPEEPGPFGPQREWYFEVLDPDYEGRELKKYTSQSFAPSSKAREFVEALIGRKVEKGEKLSFSELVGKRCMLLIGLKETERGTFETVEGAKPVRRRTGKQKQQAPEPEPLPEETEEEVEAPPF